jgi:tetratricopeptide (TPR) repeat protein
VEAEARYWKGEYVDAERAAREGRQCEDPKLALRAMSALVDALGPQAKYDEIGQLTQEFEVRPTQSELLNVWLACRYNSAAFLAAAGQFEARERILALMEAERERLDPILVGRIESMRAHIARAQGKPAEAVAGIQRAWKFFESAGHRRAGTEALGNACTALMELGQLEEAEEHATKLLAIAERMGLHHILGGTMYLLSNILAYRGCLKEARSYGERALKLTTETNDQHFRRYTQLYLSVIEYLAGEYLRAGQYASKVLDTLESNSTLRPFGLALLARALLGQGLVEEALQLASQAHARLEVLGSVEDGEATIRLVYVESLMAASNIALAKDVLRKASKRLLDQANTIDNKGWRDSFLMRIPEHCRIVELAKELGLILVADVAIS